MQKVTSFGDEAIIAQQAFLGSIGFTEEKIKELIPVALDLASATGQSLEFAVRNIAKTFSGLTGELGELIPQTKELTKEQLQAGGALKVISDLMGGSAEQNTKTMTGSLEQMTNAVGDTAEAIGNVLSPIVANVANTLKNMAEQFSDIISLSLAEKFNKEASELSVLFSIAKDVTTDLEVRSNAIKKINDNYGEYLPNLLDEKSNLNEIKNAHDSITFALLKRLELETKEAELRELMKDRSSLKQSIIDYQTLKQELIDTGNIVEQNIFGQISYTGANQEAIAALESYDLAIKLANEGLAENKDNIIATTNSASEMSKIYNSLTTDTEKFKETSKTVSEEVLESLKNKFKITNQEMERFVLNSISIGRSMNHIGKAAQKAAEQFITSKIQEAVASYITDFMKTTPLPPFISTALAVAGGAAFGSLMQQTINSASKLKFEHGGLVGGRRHSQGGTLIEAEQGEFVMNRNAVSAIGVENLNRMNQGQSSGGGSINININGGMISPDFVENELAESIREAVRRGADFGIS